MPSIDLSGAGANGLTNLDYTVSSSGLTPSAQYSAWATAIGVSDTGTDFDPSGSNKIDSLDFGTKLWTEVTSTVTELSSSAAIHWYELGKTGGIAFITVPNITPVVGWDSIADVMFSWKSSGINTGATSNCKMRTNSGVTIMFLEYEDSASPGPVLNEVALRFEVGSFDIVGTTTSGTTDFYVTPADGSNVFNNQTLMLSQTSGSDDIINITVSAGGGTPVDETALQGTVTLVGSTPNTVIGHTVQPTQGSISLTFDNPTQGQFFNVLNRENITVTGGIPNTVRGHNAFGVLGSIAITGHTPNNINAITSTTFLALQGGTPTFNFTQTTVAVNLTTTRYSAILTGAPDSLDDIEIPLSKLSLRLEQNTDSTTQVVIPDGQLYSSQVADRPSGQLIVRTVNVFNDGTTEEFLSDAQTVTNIQSSQGTKNFSIIINSSGISSGNNDVKEYPADKASFIATDEQGVVRVRLDPISGFGVGDAVRLQDNSLVIASSVVTTINERLAVMEVANG